MGLVYICLFFILVSLIGIILADRNIKKAQRLGIYPPSGTATMKDVKRLVKMGETTLALCAYREIHRISLRKAKEAIDELVAAEEKTNKE